MIMMMIINLQLGRRQLQDFSMHLDPWQAWPSGPLAHSPLHTDNNIMMMMVIITIVIVMMMMIIIINCKNEKHIISLTWPNKNKT